jgi:polyphosphate glucokinase
MKVLVVDIGGSHVKMLATGQKERQTFDSSSDLTPRQMVDGVRVLTKGWEYDVVSLGYPGTVDIDGPESEPANLGHGWVGFDFEQAFGKPVRIVNDAAMQAIGAYQGGRMLFLGLGTGLGSALLTERVVLPLDLGSLPYSQGESINERLNKDGREHHGDDAWQKALEETTLRLQAAMMADYVVLGGGQAEHVKSLPPGVRLGHNDDAFTGGFRLWLDDVEPHDRPPSNAWRVVR